MTIAELIEQAHATALEKGWWSEPERTFGDQVALCHSELSEALEEFRVHGLDREQFLYTTLDSPGKPEGIAAEFADVLVRIADTCGRYGIPLEQALAAKLAYNKTRQSRHGGKVI